MGIQSAKQRPLLLDQLSSSTFDLLVIGGGATGAGIALDAASRGMSVALLEKMDFAFGTSSRSTKLIHGGLRYLKQFEIKIVHEVGRERAILHRLAPHLVVSEPMLLPFVKGGTFGKFSTSLGLWVYDLLAGVSGKDRRVMLSKKKTLDREPLLREDILLGSGRYAEYRTDDARLTLENVKAAISYGATAANYVEVTGFTYDADHQINGVEAIDHLDGGSLTVKAHQVINAAGPWVDDLRKENQSMNNKHLFLSKGVHIVISHEHFPLHQSVYFDVADGRMIFAIPRGKVTYIGTTDTEYKGDKNNPRTYLEDVTYLLDAVNHQFPTVKLRLDQVESSWAGLRPLIFEQGKSASEISRKDETFRSDSGLISIAGGKLTGYRKMAEKVVNMATKTLASRLGKSWKACQTTQIPLADGVLSSEKDVSAFHKKIADQLESVGLDSYLAWYLVHMYGAQADDILIRFRKADEMTEAGLILAELAFGMEEEMVHTASDFLIRRTGRLYFDIHSVRQHAGSVIAAMARYFDWDEDRIARETQEILREVEEVSTFPSESEIVLT
ncbi:MAG: glycerol-3-phosphate dehydrogenase/oxidase [Bacteroidia bacterium]|nr:glycerol-3-phosphate dehydrogenase/oxidase [Bacteroidia bacterium]